MCSKPGGGTSQYFFTLIFFFSRCCGERLRLCLRSLLSAWRSRLPLLSRSLLLRFRSRSRLRLLELLRRWCLFSLSLSACLFSVNCLSNSSKSDIFQRRTPTRRRRVKEKELAEASLLTRSYQLCDYTPAPNTTEPVNIKLNSDQQHPNRSLKLQIYLIYIHPAGQKQRLNANERSPHRYKG